MQMGYEDGGRKNILLENIIFEGIKSNDTST